MREACKNILYTVVNSRAYDPANLEAGLMGWQVAAIVIDVVFAAVIIVLEVVAITNSAEDWREQTRKQLQRNNT